MPTRRHFIRAAAAAGVAGVLPASRAEAGSARAPAVHARRSLPVAIASANGGAAVTETIRQIEAGGDTTEAVVAGVNIVERDPEDQSVGYGGLPNVDGVVQLDASVMDGPSRGAGAVGSLEGIVTPASVALLVMRHTDHVFLVGEGAQRFALSMGFQVENLLTDESRERWLRWRHTLSPDDNYLDLDRVPRAVGGREDEPDEQALLDSHDGLRPWGTINLNAVDAAGNVSGVTTTSGLAYKLPGRVGDSPIIGAGLYVDNDVGACGSTGRGEAVIKTCGSHTVVELMRGGMSPTDAALEALRRIVLFTVEDRLLRDDGRPNFNVNYYAVTKEGAFGAAAIWSGARHAVNVGGETSIRDSAYLFER